MSATDLDSLYFCIKSWSRDNPFISVIDKLFICHWGLGGHHQSMTTAVKQWLKVCGLRAESNICSEVWLIWLRGKAINASLRHAQEFNDTVGQYACGSTFSCGTILGETLEYWSNVCLCTWLINFVCKDLEEVDINFIASSFQFILDIVNFIG